MTTIERLQQVSLLGLGRHACARAGTLDIGNNQRQLHRCCQTDRFSLEVHTGAAGRGNADGTAERRA